MRRSQPELNVLIASLFSERSYEDALKAVRIFPEFVDAKNTRRIINWLLTQDHRAKTLCNLFYAGLPITSTMQVKIIEHSVEHNWTSTGLTFLNDKSSDEHITKVFLMLIKKKKEHDAYQLYKSYAERLSKKSKVEYMEWLDSCMNLWPRLWEVAQKEGKLNTYAIRMRDCLKRYSFNDRHCRTVAQITKLSIEAYPKISNDLIALLVKHFLAKKHINEAELWAMQRKRPGFTTEEKVRVKEIQQR